MTEEEQKPDSYIKSSIDAATGLLKAIPIYQDVVQPAGKQIGKSLEIVSKTINIALAPIKALVWGYEKIEEYLTKSLAEKLKSVPIENITTPLPQIAGPAIEALRFTGHDDNIRELFANLIATAMDNQNLHKAHPGYVEIIKNISSDEAKLLQAFLNQSRFPIVNFHSKIKNTLNFALLYSNHSHLDKIVNVLRKDLIPSYIDNLCRLGILVVPQDLFIPDDDSLYEPLEGDELTEKYKEALLKIDRELTFQRGLVTTTSFGQYFIQNVVRPKS